MSDIDNSGNDLERFIAAWLDGCLNSEESTLLQKQLQQSASARSKFRKYTQLDVALHELADTSGMLLSAQRIASAAAQQSSRSQEKASTEFSGAIQKQPEATLPPTRFNSKGPNAFGRLTSWYTPFALAVLLLVSLFSYYNIRERQAGSSELLEQAEIASGARLMRPPAPVATLASTDQALWKNSQLKVGQALYEGDSINLQEGEARISVGFGAEVVASSPCSLSFLASDRIELHEGQVAVDVAPWAKGFTVVTDEMDVVDLGTTFTVSASPGINAKTTVLKGIVRVHPSKVQNEQRRGLLLLEGQQLSVDDKGLHKNLQQQETRQLLSNLDFGVAEPYRPVALNNTGIGLSAGDEDLHWRVVAGPEASFSGPQYATVCVPHQAYLPNYPDTSQWVSIAEWQTAAPNSIFTFQSEFNLDGYDLSTMQLFGRFLADNGIAAVRVNGEPVQVKSWVDNIRYQPFGNPQFRFVNITEGLVHGQNIIEVDVRNGMMRNDKGMKNPPMRAIPNPMALRVEWYAFGRQHGLVKTGDNAKSPRLLDEDDSRMLKLSGSMPKI